MRPKVIKKPIIGQLERPAKHISGRVIGQGEAKLKGDGTEFGRIGSKRKP